LSLLYFYLAYSIVFIFLFNFAKSKIQTNEFWKINKIVYIFFPATKNYKIDDCEKRLWKSKQSRHQFRLIANLIQHATSWTTRNLSLILHTHTIIYGAYLLYSGIYNSTRHVHVYIYKEIVQSNKWPQTGKEFQSQIRHTEIEIMAAW
jgi:hypothetical protein